MTQYIPKEHLSISQIIQKLFEAHFYIAGSNFPQLVSDNSGKILQGDDTVTIEGNGYNPIINHIMLFVDKFTIDYKRNEIDMFMNEEAVGTMSVQDVFSIEGKPY